MDKPFSAGLAVLEILKLLMYETYYDKLQQNFEQEKLPLHYIDTDGIVISHKTKDIIKDLKDFEDIFVFSNLDKNLELFLMETKKILVKLN